jgi:hypothetical protein
MWKAFLDSWNFRFEAFHENEILAIEHLKLGLNNHAKQYGIQKDWWHEYAGDICTHQIQLGTPSFNSCYRDNELIRLNKTTSKA